MNTDGPAREALYARLRHPPSPHSVPGSLPVLFFGDIFSAQIATLGINPSYREYLDEYGHELTRDARRFQTLASLQAPSRAELTDAQCEQAISTMCDYFQPGKPVYQWFRPLDLVIAAMDYAYAARKAVHLDLIQEATTPTWSGLEKQSPLEASALLVADLPFLRWQLETFPLRAVVCNGKTPLRYACGLLNQPVNVDAIAQGRVGGVTWYATRGHIGNRALAVLGWNIPLTRPAGLTDQAKEKLGHKLALFLSD
jgi:hypothetical protein